MRGLTPALHAALLSVLTLGCVPPESGATAHPDGPLARHARGVAAANGVPGDLLLAIAHVEGGLLLPRTRVLREDDDVPVAGILELRHGAYDSLARGAAMVGHDEAHLRADTELGTEAGARVLAELGARSGARSDDLASWRPAVETLSGLQDGRTLDRYLADIFALLRQGGSVPARDGETVHLAPHPELPESAIGVIRQELGGPPADFPGAQWLSTDCNGKCTAGRPDGNGAVNTIVIHDTEGGWAASVATLQFDKGKSVHYIIDGDGSRVGQFLHEGDTAWHAGNWCYNKRSIGIEHVGVAADPKGYSPSLYQVSVKLVKNIRTRWNVPLDRTHIIGHYQIPDGTKIAECSAPCSDHISKCEKHPNYGGAGNHWDPGFYWQWCQYFQLLGGKCSCNDAWDLWNCTTDKTQAVRCKNGQVEIVDCKPCESQPNGVNDLCHVAAQPDMAKAMDLASSPLDLSAGDLGSRPIDLATGDRTPFDGAALADRSDGGESMEIDGGCRCTIGGRRSVTSLQALLAVLLGIAACRRRFRAGSLRRSSTRRRPGRALCRGDRPPAASLRRR
ncbi:MAG: N-acetylmuramoyl-L-alanine amidase [Myxococcales bacterium]|nr:N-acetylmuramoyl-L-alanine amidase [Myxococcales bacterium]